MHCPESGKIAVYPELSHVASHGFVCLLLAPVKIEALRNNEWLMLKMYTAIMPSNVLSLSWVGVRRSLFQ